MAESMEMLCYTHIHVMIDVEAGHRELGCMEQAIALRIICRNSCINQRPVLIVIRDCGLDGFLRHVVSRCHAGHIAISSLQVSDQGPYGDAVVLEPCFV